jgi:DNA-binding MarR family transcriptional regulator
MILAHLNENGVSTIGEISQDVKASPQKVKMIVRSLMRKGYVRKVNQEE